MASTQPRMADRFPHYRELILRECNGDTAIAELCRDYDSLFEAIEAIESTPGSIDSPDSAHHELLKLANALEKELLDRLDQVLTADRSARA